MNRIHTFHHQRGATLLFALLTLVALMLSTLALVRSTDISTLLMGNLGFKQDATATSDQAAREAIDWLTENMANLNADISASGYYASTKETSTAPLDATGTQLTGVATRQLIDWDKNSCAAAKTGSFTGGCAITPTTLTDDINGNTASYVIFRMCSKAGDPATDSSINCVRPIGNSAGESPIRGDLNYSESERFTTSAGSYYRILVRVLGARNTVSHTETIVHF